MLSHQRPTSYQAASVLFGNRHYLKIGGNQKIVRDGDDIQLGEDSRP